MIETCSNIWSHHHMYPLNYVLFAQGHSPTLSRFQVLFTIFSPLFWLLHQPDLAGSQLTPHIKREPRLSRQLLSLRFKLVQPCFSLPSYGSDLCLWTGDASSRSGHHSGRPGPHVPQCLCCGSTGHLRGDQNFYTAHLSAAGCLEQHGEEICTR